MVSVMCNSDLCTWWHHAKTKAIPLQAIINILKHAAKTLFPMYKLL